MANSKYIIIIPIITSILFFASVAGIIGNSIILDANSENSSRISFNDLEPDEVVDRYIRIPSGISEPSMVISIDYDTIQDNGDYEMINIYLADQPLPLTIDTVETLESSSYYTTSVFQDSFNVEFFERFDLTDEEQDFYVIVGNVNTARVPVDVNFVITFQDQSTSGETDQIGTVLRIIFSSILTGIFFFGSIYLWAEYLEKTKRRILTPGLEKRFDEIEEKTVTWELVVLGFSVILLIVGYAEFLFEPDSFPLFLSMVGFGVVYFSYSKRQRITRKIHEILLLHKEIGLNQLSELIIETEEDTKKVLLDAIMYNNLPANFDFKSETISYNPNKDKGTFSSMNEPVNVISEEKFQVASTEVVSREINEDETTPNRPFPICAYCDTEAISLNALFCHSCGASMSSAK